MKQVHKVFLLIIFLSASVALTFGQSGEIKIKFIGNCGLYMTDGSRNVYVDFPYKSGAYNYMKYDVSELDSIKENSIFIFTHKHADHYFKGRVKRIVKSKKGKKYGPWNASKLEKLGNENADFVIQTFKTKHRFSVNHYSYLITWHGKRIFLSGDTERAETIKEISNMDWAFVPSWILHDAKEKQIEIDSKKIGIYHLYPGQQVSVNATDKIKLLNMQGEIIKLPY